MTIRLLLNKLEHADPNDIVSDNDLLIQTMREEWVSYQLRVERLEHQLELVHNAGVKLLTVETSNNSRIVSKVNIVPDPDVMARFENKFDAVRKHHMNEVTQKMADFMQ